MAPSRPARWLLILVVACGGTAGTPGLDVPGGQDWGGPEAWDPGPPGEDVVGETARDPGTRDDGPEATGQDPGSEEGLAELPGEAGNDLPEQRGETASDDFGEGGQETGRVEDLDGDAARDPGADRDPGNESGPGDPGPGDEGPRDPGAADSGPTDSGPTDFAVADPGVPDPGGFDPGAADAAQDSPVGPACERSMAGLLLDPAWAGGPRPNTWSWDGAWTPAAGDFPLAGLLDDEYFDGHRVEGRPTPILPPGQWDWRDADNDLANWRNFYTNLGEFLPLRDGCDRHYGWRFLPKYPEAVDFSGPGEYFEGSSGMDLLLLGPEGNLSSITGSLAGGPDVLVFGKAWSLDYRTGATGDPGADRDDDFVVAGCLADAGLDYPIRTMTIHTGPGADVIFARNLRAAALDAGNGLGGRTDTLDPTDGDDWTILAGNVKDVRFFGGHGNDVLVWYADEMKESTPYQGGDYFGGGGYGEAVFGDPGVDRLVLVVPVETRIVDRPSSPPKPGTVLVMRENSGTDEPWYDEPTLQDPYARYCITCGRGPNGERTLFVQYASADGRIDTGYVSLTAFEELQVGVGSGATVYRLDPVTGRASRALDLAPLAVPAYPYGWCDLR